MRIQFVRTGGVAGGQLSATIDSDQLPPEEAELLKEALDSGGFFNLPGDMFGGSGGGAPPQNKDPRRGGGPWRSGRGGRSPRAR